MIIRNAKYITGAAEYKHCIVSDLAQIAVAGKSNVGKSSFINFLVNDGKLARTSKLPGRTRLVNYFLINEEKENEFILADLPGYGFAKVSDAEKKKWADLLETFLATEDITLLLSLVDIRHDPTADDKMMVNYLYHYAVPFSLIATKADKLKPSQREAAFDLIVETLEIEQEELITFSAENGEGKDKVLAILEAMC